MTSESESSDEVEISFNSLADTVKTNKREVSSVEYKKKKKKAVSWIDFSSGTIRFPGVAAEEEGDGAYPLWNPSNN